MNSELEMPVEEATTLEAVPDLTTVQIVEPTDLQPYIDLCDRRAAIIPKPFDDASLLECGLTIEFYKETSRMAARRKAELEEANKGLLDAIEWWGKRDRVGKEKAKALSVGMNQFVYERQQAKLLEQQREIARAAEEKRKLQQQEDDARAKAAQALIDNNPKAAAKAEAKADQLAVQADMVVPEVLVTQSKTLDLGAGVTLSAKAPKKIWMLPGWDKKEKLYGDDARLKGIDAAWLLRFCVLDPVKLNKAYGSVDFPAPFYDGQEFGGTVLRGGK